MTYEVWQGFAASDAGDVLDGATVTVTVAGTEDGVTLFEDKDGAVSLANPFLTDATGLVRFYAAAQFVDIIATKGADTIEFMNVRLGLPDALQTVATLAELQDVVTAPLINNVSSREMTERTANNAAAAVYIWRSGDKSTEVTADEVNSGQGDGFKWVAPASDLSGATGAWQAVGLGENPQYNHYGTFVPQLTAMRNGEAFPLGRAFSKSAIDSIKARTNTDDHSTLFANVLDDATNIILPSGLINLGDVELKKHTRIQGQGSSNYESNPSVFSSTAITTINRVTGAAAIFDCQNGVADGLQFTDFDMDGNGGQAAEAGDGLLMDGHRWSLFKNVKMFDFHMGLNGGSTADASGVRMLECFIRENNYGVYHLEDSFIRGGLYAGNRRAGITIDSGQVKIQGVFFEFHRRSNSGTLNGASNAILIEANAQETEIIGNTFDRNAGADIYLKENLANATNRQWPHWVLIDGNTFKGAGWAIDSDASYPSGAATWGASKRVAIVAENGEDIILGTNMVQTRSSYPATSSPGAIGPLQLMSIGKSKVRVQSTQVEGIKNPWNFDKDFLKSWQASGSGTSEYYIRNTQTSGNPFIDEPANVFASTTTLLTRGTAGALSGGEWDYADNDSLGYSTLYIRLASGGTPNGAQILAHYEMPPIAHSDTFGGAILGNLTTDAYRDSIGRVSIPSVSVFTKAQITHEQLSLVNDQKILKLELNCNRGTGSSNYRSVEVPVVMVRGTTGAVTFSLGTVATTASLGTLTVGLAGSGSDLELSIAAATPMGKSYTLTLDNKAAFAIRVNGGLKW